MARLQIYDPRERMLVGAADRILGAAAAAARVVGRRQRPETFRRILLLRLERIGDLLMTLPALQDVRRLAPQAELDLVAGSWNAAIARAIPTVSRIQSLDAAWLAREGGGLGLPALIKSARGWRRRGYDLAINFEPDVRSNLLLAMSGAQWTAGYRSGGGGALLDIALDYDPAAHTSDNARRLVAEAFGRPLDGTLAVPAPLTISPASRHDGARLLAGAGAPLIGIHASGGRAVKQWPTERFSDVACRLVEQRGATIILTGSAADRPLIDAIKQAVPSGRAIDLGGSVDLPTLAAVISRLDLLVTGDTGPMHLAHAVGTPIVAVFGPSDPARYAPRGPYDRIVRVDLPCSPCNRIRLPPARCTGHTPDCLALIDADSVFAAAVSVLDAVARDGAGGARA
jgi:lipopolysaccharide heptosyltransferase II